MFLFREIWAWGGWAEDLIIHGCPVLHHLEVVVCGTVSHCQEGSCKVRLHQHTQRVQIKGDLGIPWQSRGSELPPQGAQVQSLEKEITTPSSILAWEIPWTEEPGGLQSMGSQRVRHD